MAARKNYTAAQIINGLRRAEVGLANGKSMKEVIRDLGVSEQTYYRWRREYVCSLIPSFLMISATGVPTSPWRSAIAICSSVNLVFRIGLPLPRFNTGRVGPQTSSLLR